MKDDFRVRTTKKMICDCLLKMLMDKPLEKITVSAICDAIDINRATFYRYYANPFDLYEKIERNYFEEVARLAKEAIIANDDQGAFRSAIVATLTFVKENELAFDAIRKHRGDTYYLMTSIQSTYDDLSHASELSQPSNVSPEVNQVFRQYTGSGSIMSVLFWIEGGATMPLETFADLLVGFARECRRFITNRA